MDWLTIIQIDNPRRVAPHPFVPAAYRSISE
jgi:hypothetical protein